MAEVGELGADRADGIGKRLCRLVGDEFQRADESDAARFANQRVLVEFFEPRLKLRAQPARHREQLAFFENVEVFQRDRGRDRMSAGGKAVGEHADLGGIVGDRLIDLVGDEDRRQRYVGRRDRLGEDHEVGRDAVGLTGERIAGAAEACDHFVGDDEHVVLAAHRLDLFPVGRRRRHDAAGAHHRLADEGGDGVGALGDDRRFELFGEPRGERLLALPGLAVTPEISAADVAHERQRQVEIAMEDGHAGEAARDDRDAVVGAVARNDFLLFRASQRIVKVPDHLDREVVGLRPRRGEMRLGHARRHRDEPLGQLDGGGVRFVAERMIERQLAHLLGGRLGEARLAKTDRDAPQARQTLDVLLALVVVDIDPLAALDHHRADFLVATRIGGGVEVIGDVASGEGIRAVDHGKLRS